MWFAHLYLIQDVNVSMGSWLWSNIFVKQVSEQLTESIKSHRICLLWVCLSEDMWASDVSFLDAFQSLKLTKVWCLADAEDGENQESTKPPLAFWLRILCLHRYFNVLLLWGGISYFPAQTNSPDNAVMLQKKAAPPGGQWWTTSIFRRRMFRYRENAKKKKKVSSLCSDVVQ